MTLPCTKSKKWSPLTELVTSSTPTIPVDAMAAIADFFCPGETIYMFNSTLSPHGVTKAADMIFAATSSFINKDKTFTIEEPCTHHEKEEISALLRIVVFFLVKPCLWIILHTVAGDTCFPHTSSIAWHNSLRQ